MKRLALCLCLVMPLVLAGEAAAKKVVSAKVCGASDCRTVKDHEALLALSEGGTPTDPPGAVAFYRVQLTGVGDGERFSFPIVIAPDAGLMRGGTEAEGYTWMPVSDRAVREFREITRGLEPVPPTKLAGLDPPEARVDEVVLPPATDPAPADGAPVWPWVLGAVAALGLVVLLLRWRRRLGSPEPAEG
jgi:hypothetical protein